MSENLHVNFSWFYQEYRKADHPYARRKVIKVPLKAQIVQILFSQIHKNYAKYTFQTFTVDEITIAYQIKKYGLNKNVLHIHDFSEKPMNFSNHLRNTFRNLSCNRCCRNNIWLSVKCKLVLNTLKELFILSTCIFRKRK
jgi:hypothetical protein